MERTTPKGTSLSAAASLAGTLALPFTTTSGTSTTILPLVAMERPARRDERIPTGGGDVAGWFWAPAGVGPHPCVVLGHGFGATRQAHLDPYVERFVAAGYAALSFDYRHFGGSDGEPRQVVDLRLQQEDWAAVLAHARQLPEVDPLRVAIWGTSVGGGHVIRVAARHPEVAAAIAQLPFVDGLTMALFTPPWTLLRLAAAAVRDEVARVRGSERVRVGIVGPPGAVAAMTTPDAEPGYLALFEPGAHWTNDVPAGAALRVPLFRPIRDARDVRCPILLLVALDDAIAAPGRSFEAARRAPRAEIRTYRCGHFDVYYGDLFEQCVSDQVEFLRRHVPVEASPS